MSGRVISMMNRELLVREPSRWAGSCASAIAFVHSEYNGSSISGPNLSESSMCVRTRGRYSCRVKWMSVTVSSSISAHKPDRSAGLLAVYRRGFGIYECGPVYIPESAKFSVSSLAQQPFGPLDSPNRILLAHSWLKECETSHTECQRDASPQLPTRVVDVGLEANGTVRLAVPEQGSKGRYLVLSYCWGRSNPFLTTTSSISANMSSIEMDQLPQTLRDAVSYTKKLGFRYIWIDALCIIQDDPHDWRREAAKMCSIYENATLSLSVLDRETCETGFLDNAPCAETLDVEGTRVTIGLGRTAKGPALSALECSVLETRAWTLQERTLAPAILHFDADRIIWECCHGTAWERKPTIAPECDDQEQIDFRKYQDISITSRGPRQAMGRMTKGAKPHKIFALRPILRSATVMPALDLWYAIVVDYMRRDISYSSDRRAAIHGLATRFQRCVAGDYFAGLWSQDLHVGLLWQPLQTIGGVSGDLATAPSWSWLKVEGPVRFQVRERSTSKATFEVRSSQPVDSLSADWLPRLHVCGTYVKGTLDAHIGDTTGPYYFSPESDDFLCDVMFCTLDHEYTVNNDRTLINADGAQLGDVYCLFVAREETWDKLYKRDTFYYHCLVLKKVQCSTEGWTDADSALPCFHCIGVGDMRFPEREDGYPLKHDTGEPLKDGQKWLRAMHTHQVRKSLILV